MEDISGAFSSSTGTPDARDDTDVLPAGSHGPATGNVITGAGTTSGKAGADIAAGGHVVAVRGSGGTDASDSGSALHVEGRYGVLTLDAHGDYRYTPNAGAPDNVRDLFQYTLANSQGGRDTADLVIELGGGAVKVNANAQRIVPGADGVITLPAGVDLTDVHVVGRDLVVDLPNGQQMIIVDGAVFVPQLVLGGVEVPASNVAELLIDSEIKPASGTPQSSGGNFADPVGPLDPGSPLGDLIPPTELVFIPPEFRDIGQFVDKHPDAGAVSVQLDDDALAGGNAGGVGDDADSVNATGFLPGSGGDGSLTWDLQSSGAPAGFSYVDGPNGSILVEQVQGGNTVIVLTITIDASTGAYTVVENAAILHATGADENNAVFGIGYTVTDSDGDVALGTLTINVDDDTPTVTVTAGPDADVNLTTHDAATVGANSEAVSTTANFSGVFSGTTVSPGADGAGSGTTSGYALSTTGGASGLSSHGAAINLYNVGGVIVGSTAATSAAIDASNTIFTVSTSNTGIVTLTQFSQIDHTNTDPSPTGAPFTDQSISLADGAITLTRSETVVDRDGDSVTGSAAVQIGANLHFVDDGPTISLADRGEPTVTVDETNLSLNGTANFAANFSASFGADGPAASGSVTYALGISAPGANSGLVDVASGLAIVLVQNGNVVEGHVGTAAGALSFTVSVDASGTVTLDQILAIAHTPDTGPDQSTTLSADNLVTLTATAHDFDGDTASSTINIGTNLIFHDDAPTVANVQAGTGVTLDETAAGTPAGFPISATSSAAVVSGTIGYGADGAGSTGYGLSIVGGGATPLQTAIGDYAITLVQTDAQTITGQYNDGSLHTAFSLHINANGTITVTENVPLEHLVDGSTAAAYNDALNLAGLIDATIVVTDRDGDTSSGSVGIGNLITFLDDGPSIDVTASADAGVLVQTQDADTIGGASDTASSSANFGGVFGLTYSGGADGAAGVPVLGGYALGVSVQGVDSGLNQGGSNIYLYNIGGVVVGSTSAAEGGVDSGNTVFNVSVSGTGVVTLNQFSQIDHPIADDPSATGAPFADQIISLSDGLVTLSASATVTDNDGDTATDSVMINIGANLQFADDGPSIHLADRGEPTLVVDETTLGTNDTQSFAANFAVSFGADGPAASGSVTYALGISAPGANSGLVDVATGSAIVLVQNGAVVEGHVGDASGALAFSVSVNAAGDVTLDQVRALAHTPDTGPDQPVTLSADNLVTLTATAHDFDGDTASSTLNIGQNLVFHDDAPTAAIGTTGQTVSLDETVGVQGDSNDVAGPLAVFAGVTLKGVDPDMATQFAANANAIVNSTGTLFGADGPGTAVFSLTTSNPLGTVDSGLNTTDGHDILLTLESGIVVGRVSGGADDGKAAFAVSIDSSGHISMVEWLSIQHPNTGNPDDSVSIANGAVLAVVTATDGDGDTSTASTAIGGLLSFQDDGPTAAIGTTEQSVSLDETVGVQGDSNDVAGPLAVFAGVTLKGVDPDMVTQFAANANPVVNSTGTLFGADGPGGTPVFSLTTSNPLGTVDSGLNTTDGHDILLTLESGIVVGRVSGGADAGKAAFAISIDSTGHVSMVEWLSIQHPNTGNPDDSVSIANGAVLAVVTATDGDGDTSTASTAIGGLLSFQDDGPSIDVTATSDANVLVQTQDHDTIGAATDTASSSANFGGIFGFTSSGGSDGTANTPSLSYALDVAGYVGPGGIDSGLDQAGGNIYLYEISGKVVGSTSATLAGVTVGNTVFDVGVNGTGVVTLTQYSQIDHPIAGDPTPSGAPFADQVISLADGLVTLTASASIIDGDGDTATDSATVGIGANLQFADDGPVATNDTDTIVGGNGPATGNVITGVDIVGGDTNTTDGNADAVGADTPGTITKIQSVNVGANVDTTYDGSGNLVVNGQYGTLTINANGSYSYLRTAPDGGVSDTFTYTLTDRDGDTSTATLTIGIEDHFPMAGTVNVLLDDDALAGGNPGTPAVGDDTPDTQNLTGNLPGSDGDAPLTFSLALTGAPSGFTYVDGPGESILVQQGGITVITVTITNTTTGAYTVVQNAPILHDTLNGVAGDNTENNQLFAITYNVTDSDGDVAAPPGTININVDDDTPTIDVTKGADGAIILTTDDPQTIGAASDTASSSANFGGVFGLSFSAGADGTNTTPTLAYTLGVSSQGVDSGLDQGGANIYLYNVAGVVVGSTSATQGGIAAGNTVFDVTVSGTGVVTLTQYSQLDHPIASDPTPTGAPFSDQFVTLVDTLVTLTASASITDKDGDTATDSEIVNIGANLHFTDDGPTAAINVVAGQNVSVDESVGIQSDSNDTTNGTVIALFSGVTNKGTDTDLPQYATNANAIVTSTGSTYGADGAGTTVFSLNVSGAGVDSGLNTTDGTDILLYKEGNLIVGRVGSASGAAAFAIAIDSGGHISTVEYLSIQNPDATNPDDMVSIANLAVTATVTVTDFDGDTSSSTPVGIGSHIQFQDSGPVMTAADNINIQNDATPTYSGAFAFNLGADGAPTSNDVISIGASSATVNGVAVTNYVLTAGVENATSASYSFSFDYPNGTGTTAHETGTLVFDKAAGTYTVNLADPISGFSILATAGAPASAFVNYNLGTSTTSSGPSEVAVVQLDTNFFLQFSGVYDKTGSDHLSTTGGTTTGSYNPVTSATFSNLDLFTQLNATVTLSSSAAGVAGNTIQGGEVLDFNLYSTNHTGVLGATPDQNATSMFIALDGIGSSEDMIIILKLYDTVTHQYTEQALMVQNGDIIVAATAGQLAGTAYAAVAPTGNNGLIVIEANDYQNGNTHLVIVGAQIAGSDDGITGFAANFNGTIGAGGGSDFVGTQAFSTDASDAPFKITNIGFALTTTQNQNAHLSFDVTIHDGDGDAVTQTITADVTQAADSATAISLGAAVTTVVPVVLDLNGDGVHFLGTDAGVHYDYGNGSVATAWAAPDDGILVRDANHNGSVDNASEFVFGSGGVTDLAALAAFDTNHDGQLSSADADFGSFAVWQDANSNGVVDAGEMSSLTARGISSISLSSDGIAYSAAGGDVQVAGSGSFAYAGGSSGVLADAAFATGTRGEAVKTSPVNDGNTAILAAALAAAGLAADPALASHAQSDGTDSHSSGVAGVHNEALAPIALDVSGGAAISQLGDQGSGGSNSSDQAPASPQSADDGPANAVVDNAPSAAPTELLQGTDAPVHNEVVDQMPVTAAAVAMPAPAVAEADSSAAGGSAHSNAVVSQVLVDALHGGGGGTLDALINALPNQGGGSAEEALASHAAGAVSNGDTGVFAGFQGVHMGLSMEAMVVHQDAIPAHA